MNKPDTDIFLTVGAVIFGAAIGYCLTKMARGDRSSHYTNLQYMSVPQLRKVLAALIADDTTVSYELAAEVRDIIKRKTKTNVKKVSD